MWICKDDTPLSFGSIYLPRTYVNYSHESPLVFFFQFQLFLYYDGHWTEVRRYYSSFVSKKPMYFLCGKETWSNIAGYP